MTEQLFRTEALNEQSTKWTGNIIMSRPIPMYFAGLIACLFSLILICYVVVGEYTKTVRVIGQLVPSTGVLKAVAFQQGRITNRYVKDGDVVKVGQPLYELSSEREAKEGGIDKRINSSLGVKRELIIREKIAQAEQLNQREKSLQTQRGIIDAEIIRLGQEIDLQNIRVESANKSLARYRSLREQGFISEFQLTQYENDRTEQLGRIQTLERAKLSATREMLQSRDEGTQILGQIRINSSQAERDLANLEQEIVEHNGRSRLQILSPADGVVTTLTAEIGQAVGAGESLATVIPSGSDLEAHLIAPSKAIGFIEPGQQVLIRLAAFPYQKFGQQRGKIIRVETSPINGGIGLASSNNHALESGETLYRVVVSLDEHSIFAYGKEQKFRAGMTLEADIRQDRRRLIEWVIDPLISVAKGRAG